jgi:tripartite-type tricarboxylate transporter receptor subunit TctC
MTIVKALLGASLCAVSVLLGISDAQTQSQDYPNRPIRMVVPFPAGGPTDGMARIVSDRLGAVLGQTVIVENRGGGAGGSIGAKFVATSDPDGYTILITPGGALTTGPAVHKEKIGYDPVKVFVPVAQLIEAPIITSVHPNVPVKSLAELVAYAKANPSKVNWGSQGFGTAPHLLAELFKLETGVNIVHVPFRGTAPLLAAIIAGQVQVAADPSTTSLPHIQNGKLRPIAVNSKQRFSKLPDVPTVFEAGFPYLENTFWLGVVAPAKTPPEIISKLNGAFRESLKSPETRTRLANLGAEIKIGTPAEFGEYLAEELAKWNRVVKDADITVK